MRFRNLLIQIVGLLAVVCVVLTCAAAGIPEEKGPMFSAKPLTNGLLEVNSNRHVQPFSTEIVESQLTTDGFRQVGETGQLKIYLNETEGAMRFLNKETGYLWGALPVDKAEGLNSSWRCYGNGLVSLECFNSEGIESRVSIGKNGEANYQVLENGLLCSLSFGEMGISFQVKVTWEGSKVTMEMVEGSLEEGLNESTYLLKSMTFLPFLGSSYSDSIPGYILIPDGSGALIRYRQPANYSSTYSARIYGADYAIASISSTAGNNARPEAQVLMPVYGMVHGVKQNGFMAVVDRGAEYASILAAPAQKNNPYNWAAARFEFRQKYVKNINRKEGAGANVPQEFRNEVLPKISFYFTDGEQAHYDGMAVLYRNMLIDRGMLTPLNPSDAQLPLHLEVLGADKKKNFLWDTTQVFTTAAQAEEICSTLSGQGIRNLDMVYRCYTVNNEAGRDALRALGSGDAFLQLQSTLKNQGGNLYFYLDPVTARKEQITLRTEAANNLSRAEIKWNGSATAASSAETYLYRLSEAGERVQKAIAQHYSGEFALAEMTNRLYGDFTSGKEITRQQSLEKIMGIVRSLSENGKIAMYQPNQYLWQYTDKVLDMPITNSQILYESDSVPFVEIVLSGCMQMYGAPINSSSYSNDRLLRQIEYGLAPSFTVTGCDSIDLYNTNQESYFSTCFADWQPQILQAYREISAGLDQVWGRSIVSHTCLSAGVVRVTYEGGTRIYLNYTGEAVTAEGVSIEPGSFTVVGGD